MALISRFVFFNKDLSESPSNKNKGSLLDKLKEKSIILRKNPTKPKGNKKPNLFKKIKVFKVICAKKNLLKKKRLPKDKINALCGTLKLKSKNNLL